MSVNGTCATTEREAYSIMMVIVFVQSKKTACGRLEEAHLEADVMRL